MPGKCIIILLSFLLVFYKPGHAQLEADHWMFGYDYYVFFNHGTIPDTVRYPYNQGIFIRKGSVSYSDRNGNLLFYAGAGSGLVFDRNFQPFPSTTSPGGTPLLGVGIDEVSQPILVIPWPGNDSLFIIFHIRSEFTSQVYTTLFYSVINMKLRNGLGEFVPGQKNIPLLNGAEVAGKLTAILHCNKRDIWVTGHLIESDKYYSLEVTQAGINPFPVYFTGNYIPKQRFAGPYHYDLVNNTGCVKVSAQGNRIAAAFQGMDFVELMDFNTQTGTGANLKTLSTLPPPADTVYDNFLLNFIGPYGVDFSPTGDRLYTNSMYLLREQTQGSAYAAYIHQFDASLPSATQIQNSRYRVDSINGLTSGAIQIGNNGRMYMNINDHLYEVANPEGLGNACNYNGLAVYSGEQYPNRNLPTYLQSYFRYPVIATGNCQFTTMNFSIQNLNGISSVAWDFGDPASGIDNTSPLLNPVHVFSSQGSFTVTAVLQNANGCGADTIRKVVHAGPFVVYLGRDTTICEKDTLLLKMNIANSGNLWSTGSRDTVIKVTESGKYWVRTNIGDCVASDTINVTVRPLPAFSLGKDTIICANQPITLSPTPNPPGVTYNWNTGSAASSINTGTDGLYWLQVTENGYGCKYRDSINIQFKTLPGFSLGKDTSICETQTVSLNAAVPNASGYLWNTGEITPMITASQDGIYWADVSKDGCIYRDSIRLTVKLLPVVHLGSDTTLCEDIMLRLDAGNPGSLYLWQDNSKLQTFNVAKPARYFVKVTLNGCAVSDTIKIDYNYKPIFTLGSDLPVCDGQTLQLVPKIKNNTTGISYLWSTGATTTSIPVSSPGTYSLELTNNCGSRTDELNVYKGVCKLYVPSAFTPNNDGKNDVFRAMYGENVTSYSMEIYNRWGQRVFQTGKITEGWDGRVNGTLQATATYIWVIRYKAINEPGEKILKGTVNLLR